MILKQTKHQISLCFLEEDDLLLLLPQLWLIVTFLELKLFSVCFWVWFQKVLEARPSSTPRMTKTFFFFCKRELRVESGNNLNVRRRNKRKPLVAHSDQTHVRRLSDRAVICFMNILLLHLSE